MRPLAFLLGCLTVAFFPVLSPAQPSGLTIRVSTAAAETPGQSPLYLNGYRRAISGTTMPYHSSHPFATEALICRTRGDMPAIAWETDTVRGEPRDGKYRFLWLAGTDLRGFGPNRLPRNFHLSVNGQPWFVFHNRKDSTARHWIESGPEGATLEFRCELTDTYGDVFGTMTLTAPASRCPAGAPLRIDVRAEDVSLPDWYMTFQYAFDFVPGVRMEPVLGSAAGSTYQVMRVSLDNLRSGRRISIESAGQRTIEAPLVIGANAFLVPVTPVSAPGELPVRMFDNGVLSSQTRVAVRPVPHRRIFLVPYSHNDIGYSDPQPAVLEKQWSHLEQALDLIDKTSEYPADARFRWNVEMLWPLDLYMRQATPAERSRVVEAVKGGRLGLNAFYGGVLTGLAQPVEMSHFFDYARQLRAEYGFSLETAVLSDIPGFTWGVVPALAQSGIKYFAIAPNVFDRVGHVYEPWGDNPFTWSSQSGEERVLAWLAGASYSSFHDGALGVVGEEKMFDVLRRMEARAPAHDIVHLPYTINGDNGPPDPGLSDFVRSWNERYAEPRLVIATHGELFRAFEAKHGSTLKTHSGDFTPYWEDGAVSSAAEVALARRAVDRLVQAEALWSFRSPHRFPTDVSREAWRNVTLWDEHTWGASNSITEPDAPAVKAQWAYKRQFAVNADSLSRDLLEGALQGPGGRIEGQVIDIVNTHSWERTDLVVLARHEYPGVKSVFALDGERVPAQVLSSGELAFLASDVPAFGSRRYFLSRREQRSALVPSSDSLTITNGQLSVRIDPRTGAVVSFKDRPGGKEWVEASSGGLNAYRYVLGRDGTQAQGLSHVSVRLQESGPLVSSILITGDAPGCRSYSAAIRLTKGLNRLDIINRFDKAAVREKEAVHIAFPFALPNAQVRYDVASAIVRPELDQLAGSCKNYFSAQSWMDVSSTEEGITTALVDAPLFQIGAINAEKPWMRTVESSSTLYSYVLNNYWHTNYKADQEGPLELTYQLRPHGPFDPVAAAQFALDCREPLLVVPADTARRPLSAPFTLAPAGIVALSVRPVGVGNALVLFLYNPSALSVEVSLKPRGNGAVSVSACDPDGRRASPLGAVWSMKPHATMHVRLEMK